MTNWEPTPDDLRQISEAHVTVTQVLNQLAKFRKGTTPVCLIKPCTKGDGIEDPTETSQQELVDLYDASIANLDLIKFVPASGAATRMFKQWFNLIEAGTDTEAFRHFAQTLPLYAFASALTKRLEETGHNLDELLTKGKEKDVMAAVLTEEGLNYGHLPKALLLFHRYREQVRTAMEEHFVEAAGYARGRGDRCHIHFTISPEFQTLVRRHLERVVSWYESACGVQYTVDLSEQRASTDTVAVDLDNEPFRDEQGRLVFRPAGHGALLCNLNELEADIVFIKNIDNVAHERFIGPTIASKKMLAGCLLFHRKRIFDYLEKLTVQDLSTALIAEIAEYCKTALHLYLPEQFSRLPAREQSAILFSLLNRPIRVGGMVKNTGEPGGGPFWVKNDAGETSLQVIEQFQVDEKNATQITIWRSSTHFNPVDLVCSFRDYTGRKFDLERFADQNAICISVKSEKGRALKALELPGLWNGAMGRWISLFVEVPLITFNPVKTVEDLLRKEHLPA